jgi:hypothetical protein
MQSVGQACELAAVGYGKLRSTHLAQVAHVTCSRHTR